MPEHRAVPSAPTCAPTTLDAAAAEGADCVQFFLSDPQSWKAPSRARTPPRCARRPCRCMSTRPTW